MRQNNGRQNDPLPMTACLNELFIIYTILWSTGLRTFLPEGHISCYTTVQGSDMLRNVNASGYFTFYQFNKYFIIVLFFHCSETVFAAVLNGFVGRKQSLCLPDLARGLWLGDPVLYCSNEPRTGAHKEATFYTKDACYHWRSTTSTEKRRV